MSEAKQHVYYAKTSEGSGNCRLMTSREALRQNRIYEATGLSLRWIPATGVAKREYEELEREAAE